MNTLQGQIISVNTYQQLSLVAIDICGEKFQSIVIETPESASYLKKGNQILVKFKETEVILSDPGTSNIGISNSCEGRIIKITKGELLMKVSVETRAGNINAILPKEAAAKINLKKDEPILVFVQSTEIMLAE